MLLFGLLRAAEADESLATGFFWSKAAPEIFFHSELQMGRHLGVELAVESGAVKEREQAV